MYLDSFTLPSRSSEEAFYLNFPNQLEMQCYSHTNIYPFKIFPQKELTHISFAPITLFYGTNGSGKSTLLNVISEKLGIEGKSPFNDTPFMEDYLNRCEYELSYGINFIPDGSRRMTSDDVFEDLLDLRSLNGEINERREQLFKEYVELKSTPMKPLQSITELDGFKKQLEAKSRTKSQFTAKRTRHEVDSRSNGETAFNYFTENITDGALYLLDEPENSLSAELQCELAKFIEDSARFFKCQFIISTHSPFILSMSDARIYDLDSTPVTVRRWTELKNVRIFYDFFKTHSKDFEKR